jgi:hypothetical protein
MPVGRNAPAARRGTITYCPPSRMTSLTTADLRATLAAELTRIPNPDRSLTQAVLLSAYLRARERSLGRTGRAESPGRVLAGVIRAVRRRYPRVRFVYDREFFAGQKAG